MVHLLGGEYCVLFYEVSEPADHGLSFASNGKDSVAFRVSDWTANAIGTGRVYRTHRRPGNAVALLPHRPGRLRFRGEGGVTITFCEVSSALVAFPALFAMRRRRAKVTDVGRH